MVIGKLERTTRGGFKVEIDGSPLDPEPSLKVVNHSPDGFAWGYAGSGPSQLALAILMHYAGKTFAQKNYMDFKFEVIAKLPQDQGFELTDEFMSDWIEDRE